MGGLYTIPSDKFQGMNHGANLVGYGKYSATGKEFWKIRNSWGTTWVRLA